MRMLTILAAIVLAATLGCGQKATVPANQDGTSPAANTEHSHDHVVNGWCIEHGVPEDKCSQCSKKAADEFKKNGDWCKEHNRAESQCFVCNPELEAKFAAQYKVQTGEDLPKPHKH